MHPPASSTAAATLPREPAERRRARRGHSADPAEPHIYRQCPPRSVDELQRQAHQIIQQLDSVECDVHLTPFPANNGVRQVRRQPGAATTGSLDRLALRQIKNNKNDVKFRSTNALPSFGQRTKTADADKNNLIKAESLKREGAGRIAVKKPEGYLKTSNSGSYHHLNNINLLQQQQQKSRGISHRRGSGVVGNDEDLPDKYLIEKSFRETYDTSRELSQPMKRHSLERSTPPKVVDSSSQTPAGFNDEPDVIYTQVMHQPRPDVGPKPSATHGFSYLNERDAELIEHAQSVQDRSRYIIQKIARERSRSPAHKAGWTSQRVSGSISPPPPVLPRNESPDRSVQKGRYGSSIVLIGAEPDQDREAARAPAPVPPPPRPPPPRGHQHYSVPRTYTDSNIIRLSVSGSHSSSAGEPSPNERRRRSISHEPTPPPPMRSGLRSKSSSPDRYFYGMSAGEASQERRDVPNVVPPIRRRRAPPVPRQTSTERRLPLTPHQRAALTRHEGEVTPDRSRGRLERERSVEPSTAQQGRHNSPDKKKKIKIKFIYDDTRDEPSDVRLAKYTEYRGSDEARSASPPAGERPPLHSVVQIDIEDGAELRQEKTQRQREQFLAHFLSEERVGSEERRDGRRMSPDERSYERDQGSYDKDLHGVWSSLDEEDQLTARQQVSAAATNNLNNGLHASQDQRGPSLVNGNGRPQRRLCPPRQSSVSPERGQQTKKKSWLSSTLGRLDFKARRQAEARAKQEAAPPSSGRPVVRAASHNDRRPPARRAPAPEARQRSGSRESRSGSREPAPRRPPGRTPSFSQRYCSVDSDASAGDGPPRRPRSLSSSVGSSQPERVRRSSGAAGSGGSSSSRSVFLHATTVADIPPPDPNAAPVSAPPRQRRKVGRSFSLVAPFRPKRKEKEIVYENQTGGEANGRPPRPPPPVRRGSRDSLLDRRPARPRAPVARSVSMPKDARAAGFMGRRQVAAR